MTEDVSLFFDTDCFSSFLWAANGNLLVQMYGGRIILPAQVYEELSNPVVPQFGEYVQSLIGGGFATICGIQVGTVEYRLYRKLTEAPEPGHRIIGKGEASAIALAKANGGILASNNLRDVGAYVAEFGLRHMTTGDILSDAYTNGLISEAAGNHIWADMLARRQRLGFSSFSEYLLANKE